MIEIIAIGAILLIVGAAAAYLIRAKRSGAKCVGCPYGKACAKGGKCSGSIELEKLLDESK